MIFVFQPDFQIGARIHTFACDLMCGPVIVILILYVLAGDGALTDDPAANLFGNGVCGIETGLHSLAQRFADSIAVAHSAMDQRLFGVCAVCKEAGLRTVAEPGNGQLLADSLNHAPVDCAFDGCNVAPTITGNNRRQILLMDKRRGLPNLRDCTAGIVTVKYVDSKLCRCGNAGCRIRAAKFNFPIFSSNPRTAPHEPYVRFHPHAARRDRRLPSYRVWSLRPDQPANPSGTDSRNMRHRPVDPA